MERIPFNVHSAHTHTHAYNVTWWNVHVQTIGKIVRELHERIHIVALNDTYIHICVFLFAFVHFGFCCDIQPVASSLSCPLCFSLCYLCVHLCYSLLLNSLVKNTLNVDILHVNVLCDHCHRIICNFYWAQVNTCTCVCVWIFQSVRIHFILFVLYVFYISLFRSFSLCFSACMSLCAYVLIVHLVYIRSLLENCHSNQCILL